MPLHFTAAPIRRGDGAGEISIHIEAGVARFIVQGDPDTADIKACLAQAMACGMMLPRMPVVVDLRGFSGSVDWSAVREIARMFDPGRLAGPASRVAYVGASSMIAALIKIVSVLFPWSRHRLFLSEEEALAWTLA